MGHVKSAKLLIKNSFKKQSIGSTGAIEKLAEYIYKKYRMGPEEYY